MSRMLSSSFGNLTMCTYFSAISSYLSIYLVISILHAICIIIIFFSYMCLSVYCVKTDLFWVGLVNIKAYAAADGGVVVT